MCVNILVAVGTIALAIAAFMSIRKTNQIIKEETKRTMLGRAPIFQIKEYNLQLSKNTGLFTSLRVKIKNVGFGPAFQISLKCVQGIGKLEGQPIVPGIYETLVVIGNIPTHLVTGEEGEWDFKLAQKEAKIENADKDLILTISCESIFGKKTVQKFTWKSTKEIGGIISETTLPIFSGIDFGDLMENWIKEMQIYKKEFVPAIGRVFVSLSQEKNYSINGFFNLTRK